MGVRYPDTGRDRKGEGETQEQRAGETGGWGRESKRVPRALAEVGVGGLLALRLLLYSLECVGVPSAGHPCPLGPAWPGTF